MKGQNLWIIEIKEGEEVHDKGSGNTFNKIVEENFPNLKKEVPIKVQDAHRTLKWNSPWHTIIKKLNTKLWR